MGLIFYEKLEGMVNLVFDKEENSKAEHLCNEWSVVHIVLYYNIMQISCPFETVLYRYRVYFGYL